MAPQPPAMHDAFGDLASRHSHAGDTCGARRTTWLATGAGSRPRAEPSPLDRCRGESRSQRPILPLPTELHPASWMCLHLRDANLGSPPRWNRDPKTGIEAPLRFGKLLDYRNPRLVGDIKYLWEPNRHLHLVTLAQAHVLSRDARYFEVLRQHLDSWFDACPYPMGPNWTSALEAAIRLINWSVAWQLLGGARAPVFQTADGARLRQRWLESVYRHMQFVCGHFSLDSSANNHLIGEAAGLFVAALTWPHWRATREWVTTAKTILEQRDAVAECARRRQPGAGRVLPAVCARSAAAHVACRQGEWAMVLGCLRIAH